MAHLGTWKSDCTRKTHRCPNTGMMLIKDVWKYPGAGLVGRSHPNQRYKNSRKLVHLRLVYTRVKHLVMF